MTCKKDIKVYVQEGKRTEIGHIEPRDSEGSIGGPGIGGREREKRTLLTLAYTQRVRVKQIRCQPYMEKPRMGTVSDTKLRETNVSSLGYTRLSLKVSSHSNVEATQKKSLGIKTEW